MDAWLLPETKVMKFSSIIFKEEFPRGPVKKLELKGKK
jgi:AMMECR1 domain-containing protein